MGQTGKAHSHAASQGNGAALSIENERWEATATRRVTMRLLPSFHSCRHSFPHSSYVGR